MSKMSQIHLEIQDRLAQDQDPKIIAKVMEIPITWVFEVEEQEQMQEYTWFDDSGQG